MVRVWERRDANDVGPLTAGERRIKRQKRSKSQ